MELKNTHDTHNLSCSSSESHHSYRFGNNSSSKMNSQDDIFLLKKEEKNNWSQIINDDYTNVIDNELFGTDRYNNTNNKDKKDFNKRRRVENSNMKSRTFSRNKIKKEIKEKLFKKEKKSQKKEKKENQLKVDKKKSKGKKEKIKEENKDKKEKQEKEKEEKDEKYRLLKNGILVKKIKKIKDDNQTQNSQYISQYNTKYNSQHNSQYNIHFDSTNAIKEKIEESQNLNYLDNKNSDNNDNIRQIKKPSRIFITKFSFKKTLKNIKNKKNIYEKNNKNSSQNINVLSMDDNKNVDKILQRSFSSVYSSVNRKKRKSKTTLISKNINNNNNKNYNNKNDNNNKIDKFEEKIISLSNKSPKQLCISNSHLFFNSINNNYTRKRPLSSNIIKKEIDINLKSSKNDNSFYNKSFNSLNVQRVYQISSVINLNKNYTPKKKEINEIIYENKYFFNQLKELKNAFELSDNNIDTKINRHIFSEINNRNNKNHTNSEKNNDNHNIIKKKNIIDENKYNVLYPSPLFFEFSNINYNNNMDEFSKNENKNYCSCKCDYKKHFGSEQKCPLCVSRKEGNKLMERQLSNLSYYFPFKNKYNNNNLMHKKMHNSFKKRINNTYKLKYMDYESLINFVNTNKNKEKNIPENNYYNPFNLNKINGDITKKNKTATKVNSVRHIKRDKNKIHKKYKALQAYFD